MTTLAVLDAGTYYHHRTIYEPRYRDFFDEIIYTRDLPEADLSGVDTLLVSCRTDPSVLRPRREQIADFLASGKTVVAMGSTGHPDWLPNVNWTDTPTNFWWWKEGGEIGLKLATPDHPLFNRLSLADVTWHYHGYFQVPDGAQSLVDVGDLGSIFYEDTVSTPGRLLITSLDPMYHHGSYFMPATTRFLDGFLPFLKGTTAELATTT
ncbi:hypothetical protein FIV06_16740 [Labrenzia sp. THAF191b]|uniref:hypothetical protein n=1 Tax=unclassified Labrenzia TaxID=2648686 RepID=UPI00126872CC|nr:MULTISPECIES: hypothetical protein [unclassified Labrenzia]QFS99080.1 hypothetical protein FIV06_16740 [Labrenzia sp. THAF191b]QFT05394.1 hypothetical protein FIV05_16735 [Labrenzia sp. THAF191a]QFT16938.1 hypothetical protein FIV03_16750 [Labrenzia sp. THAF187b]